MKYIIPYLLLAVFTLGCNDDDGNGGDTTTIENSHLAIDEIKNYIPSEYLNESSLVYVDKNENEKLLHTSYVSNQIERTHTGLKYTADQFVLTIYDPEDAFFQIVISGSANYTGVDNIVKTLGGNLMPFNDSGTTWVTIRFENGEPKLMPLDDFRENFEVLDRVFTDVFVTKSQQFPDAYSELDINSAVGVVAFRDEHNELWVFDRFED